MWEDIKSWDVLYFVGIEFNHPNNNNNEDKRNEWTKVNPAPNYYLSSENCYLLVNIFTVLSK